MWKRDSRRGWVRWGDEGWGGGAVGASGRSGWRWGSECGSSGCPGSSFGLRDLAVERSTPLGRNFTRGQKARLESTLVTNTSSRITGTRHTGEKVSPHPPHLQGKSSKNHLNNNVHRKSHNLIILPPLLFCFWGLDLKISGNPDFYLKYQDYRPQQ